MARWRQRRDRGAVSPVADDRSRDATRREGSNDNTPTEAAGSPRFFEHRPALVAAGDLSASSRWRERLGRASRRERAQTSLLVCSEPQPDQKMKVIPSRRCLDEAASNASPIEAGATRSVPPPRVDSWFRRGRCSEAGVAEASVLAPVSAPVSAPAVVAGRVGEVSTTLRGKAVSAMARWRQRRGPDGDVAVGPGRDGGPPVAPFTSELTRDILRLAPALLLCLIGIALTYGVCVPIDGAPERLYWRRQIFFLAVGLGLYALIGKLPSVPISRRTTQRVLYGVFCIVLPVLVLLLGRTTGNGMRWLSLFGLLSIQPAEFAKIVLIWVVAELVNPDQPLNRIGRVRRNLLALLAVAAPVGLVFLERSMGNTALLCLSVGTVLATRWFSWPILMGLFLAGVLGLIPVGQTIMEIRNPTPGINTARLEGRAGRPEPEPVPLGLTVREVSSVVAPAGATGLLSHCPDRFACYLSQAGGWNARQALRCVRLGGVEGSGYRHGSITILGYLPRTVQHTDFVYCVLSESFGFWGGLVVLGLIGWLIVVILWNGVHSRHPAAWSFSVGFATLLFLQTLIHVGMALRLLPIIGIPLPFVSYGGSFLVTSLAALGLVARYDAPAGALQPLTAPQSSADGRVQPGDRRLQQPDLLPAPATSAPT